MHYRLACVHCGKTFDDDQDTFRLDCIETHPPSLLRAVYSEKSFTVRPDFPGIFRYKDWLPVRRALEYAGRPIVYQSEALGGALGLKRLFIAFNGYWPEREAALETCSFKELEALSVCARVPLDSDKRLVVSSAGNTGRAFLQVCSMHAIPLLVVVPESSLPDVWTTVEKHPLVKLAAVRGGDYSDAIELGNIIAATEGYYPEGGARNVARRDGMGTVVLSAIERLGEIPAHYFQAVGSGTGGIAAWEACMRLDADGRFGRGGMKLHFVQNEPFAIMAWAWRSGKRELPVLAENEAKQNISRLHSRVLSNRKPPYSVAGGVFDALKAAGGEMYSVTNEEARNAGLLFESLEGVDPDPAAQVALAGMIQAVRSGGIDPEESVLLNVTGGGMKRVRAEEKLLPAEPDFIFAAGEGLKHPEIRERLRA
jgi:cysteate synthase